MKQKFSLILIFVVIVTITRCTNQDTSLNDSYQSFIENNLSINFEEK
ncbi:MAG: hypothetical protein HVN34_00905 [Methanobacteriaceae archaeon]|nr:hypothetical protein [Methanobacteriaceae archaeon]